SCWRSRSAVMPTFSSTVAFLERTGTRAPRNGPCGKRPGQHKMLKHWPAGKACWPGAGHIPLGAGAGEHNMAWNFSTVIAHAGAARGRSDDEVLRAPDSMRMRLAAAKIALQYPERVERLENGLGWRVKPAASHAGPGSPPGPG